MAKSLALIVEFDSCVRLLGERSKLVSSLNNDDLLQKCIDHLNDCIYEIDHSVSTLLPDEPIDPLKNDSEH